MIKKSRFIWLKPSRQNWFGWTALVLTILIAIFWCGNTPLHTDDFYYQHVPGPDDSTSMWLNKGEMITSFSQVPIAIVNHRLNVNGRVSNSAYLAVQPLPQPVIRYFCGLVLALLGWMFWRWCGRRSLRNNILAIAIPVLMWTGLQWGDQMQSADFQFNYILPSVMLTGCMMFFWKREKKPGIWGWLLLAVFSTWHECFTIIFGAFLFVQWLFQRDKRTFIAICILIAGALFQFSAGTKDRMAINLTEAENVLQFFPFSYLIAKSWVTFVAIGLWLLRRRSVPQQVRRSLDHYGVGMIAVLLVSIAFIVILAAPQRAHWGADILAILFVLNILRTYRSVRLPMWLKILALVIYTAWGSSLIYWQLRVTRFTNYTIEQIKNGYVAIDDFDGISEEYIPFWLMDITRLQYTPFDSWEYYSLPCVVSENKSIGYIIRPQSLHGSSFENWPKYAGQNDMRIGGTRLITRLHDGKNFEEKQLRVTFGKPTIGTSPVNLLLGRIKGANNDSITSYMRVSVQNWIVVNGDTIDVLNLERQPRTTKGRPIIAIDTLPQ